MSAVNKMLRFLLQTFGFNFYRSIDVFDAVTLDELVPTEDPSKVERISDKEDKWLIGFCLSEARTSS